MQERRPVKRNAQATQTAQAFDEHRHVIHFDFERDEQSAPRDRNTRRIAFWRATDRNKIEAHKLRFTAHGIEASQQRFTANERRFKANEDLLQTEAPRHIANRGALQDTSQIIEVHCK